MTDENDLGTPRIASAVLTMISIVYVIAGPATYALLVIRTWQSDLSLGWKIVHWLTVDLLLSAFWPVLWLLWLLKCVGGYCYTTPLVMLFG